MAGDRRFSVPLSVVIESEDKSGEKCEMKLSVRNHAISLRIEGGDEWAHMTPAQARRLARWLVRGADESEARRVREFEWWDKQRKEATHGR